MGKRPFTGSPIPPAYCLYLLRGEKSTASITGEELSLGPNRLWLKDMKNAKHNDSRFGPKDSSLLWMLLIFRLARDIGNKQAGLGYQ